MKLFGTRIIRPKHLVRDCVLLGIGGLLLFSTLVAIWIALTPTPDLTSFAGRKVTQSTKIYDRTGEFILYDLNTDIKRKVVPITEIARNLRNATVAIEDAEFYQHHGIRISSIFRAILANLTPGGVTQGGSTITQQVVKNSILTTEKSISRKVREWMLATKLEQAYTKDEILEFYLNETPYGGSVYGVEEAANTYFGKSAREVTLAEAAYLAALPQAPTYYSPYGNHKPELEARKNLVLSRMFELNFISQEEYEGAQAEAVTFGPQRTLSIAAPHFVFYIREYLEEKYGSRVLDEGGLKVVTTLDADLERIAEDVVKKYALENAKNFNAENAALVAIDPKTGQILAMVGSRDYFDPAIDGNFNAALAFRQPGSSFKPFVYAAALSKGYTRDTTIFDLPTQFSTACRPDSTSDTPPCYYPVNYDGKYRGPMTFKSALAQSINIAALKVLYLVGIDRAIDLARAMGITTLTDPARYGLTLVLGGGEVRLLDIVSGYGVFATEGVRNPPTGILRVEDSAGNVLEEYEPNPSQVLDGGAARDISDILSDDVARAPAFGVNSALSFPGYDVAVKTGTTNDYRDAWVVGYTPFISAGAWAGNNDNSPMEKKVAGFIVAPLWHEFMKQVLASRPKEYFGEPTDISPDLSPALRGVWQMPGANGETEVHDLLHWVSKKDPRGPPPTNPVEDPQYNYWEYPVAVWKLANGFNVIP